MAHVADFYNKNGYFSGIAVLSAEEVANLQTHFGQLEENTGKDDAQYSLHNVHLNHPWVMDIASHPKLLHSVRQILGHNIILLDSRFICKYPESEVLQPHGTKPYVAWHQDIRYWGVEGEVVTAWLAVDDADQENGCMCVIPGTHTLGILEHKVAEEKGNMLTSNQSIPTHLFDVTKSTPCPVKAGQMSLHSGLLVHGSDPNRSNRRRCGYVIRYVSTDAKPIKDPNRPRSFPATVVISGYDEYKHFEDHCPVGFSNQPVAT
ncbi:probable alpha-ketoglutarate-dependent hypophosphite dioxygenase [Ylistrum balloti]|uniref:probable alpha-ketoglutarate-dependent hypophosphite dioxygenase n=1 Tax=Ylistrum balloti TaxID=509963 RepID=UPI002905C1C1|nr:probable alpha-ketoglutarate-dependent hypophosphite dioxygenase [Ylistrum balloti]